MIENMPHLIRLRNGEKVQNTFSAQEYANRMAKVRQHMVAQQLVPLNLSQMLTIWISSCESLLNFS
jgi:hypothetical protein